MYLMLFSRALIIDQHHVQTPGHFSSFHTYPNPPKTFFGWAIPARSECEAHGLSSLYHTLSSFSFLSPPLILLSFSLLISTCSVTLRVDTYCPFSNFKKRTGREGLVQTEEGWSWGWVEEFGKWVLFYYLAVLTH